MVITWYGQSCFRIQSGELVVITDPFSKEIGLRPPAGQADVVTISHEHADHNNREAIKGEPFIADGPGEYSLKGADIIGIQSTHETKSGEGKGANTIFVIDIEDIRVCHLGDQGKLLTNEQLEQIHNVDILFVPIGGTYTLNTEEALEVIGQLEPKVIIPMHYAFEEFKAVKGCLPLETVDKFAKEIGCKKENMNVGKVTLKKKNLEEMSGEAFVMGLTA